MVAKCACNYETPLLVKEVKHILLTAAFFLILIMQLTYVIVHQRKRKALNNFLYYGQCKQSPSSTCL